MGQRKWGSVRIEQKYGTSFSGGKYRAMYNVAIGNTEIVDYLSGRMLFQDLSYLRIARKPVSA
jgi:hypothetical protein